MTDSSSTHVIRLRGPWDVEWPDPSEKDSRGKLRFRRRFNSPTGLEPHDEIDLVIDPKNSFGQVWLNEVLLGEWFAGRTARFGIRERVELRNALRVEIKLPPDFASSSPTLGDFVSEVRLEIRSR
jgi:hypothetical protein